jgi:hypothetical protein
MLDYYEVQVYEQLFKVEATSPATASRNGRDAWRDRNRTKDSKEMFRIPEPITVVIKRLGTSSSDEVNPLWRI